MPVDEIERASAAGINAALSRRMEILTVGILGEPTSRTRTQLRFGARGSLAIEIAGAKVGIWYNHETGDGGGPVDFIMHIQRCAFRDAITWAAAWLGGDLPRTAAPAAPVRQPRFTDQQAAADRAYRADLAATIWGEAVDPTASPVETYLARRALRLPAPGPIRFHRACPRGTGGDRPSAMVALMANPVTGVPVGVHRTYLTPAGQKALGDAKMMLGGAGVIKLSADDHVTTGLGLVEGIETGLTILQVLGWAPVWACGSAGAIATFPVLPGVEALSIFADQDDAGMKAARACVARWTAAGREASIIAAPSGDWNDAVQARTA